MKKLKVALLLTLVLIMLSATALAGTMYINRSKQKPVKMYNGNNEVICKIPYRAAVETHSRSKIDNERMEVGYQGHWGWVYSRYLSSTKPPKVTDKKEDKKEDKKDDEDRVESNVFSGMNSVVHYMVVVRPSTPTTFVNLRWAPSKNAKIRTTRYSGDTLRVIAENKGWAQVMDDATGECGFMMRRFLERIPVDQ